MSNIFITSEYFSKFSPKGKELLEKAGHRVIDNPYGHKFLSPEEIIPYVKEADALICDLEKINRQVIDAAPNLKIISRGAWGWTVWMWTMPSKKALRWPAPWAWWSPLWRNWFSLIYWPFPDGSAS